jgi:hypothetical protein
MCSKFVHPPARVAIAAIPPADAAHRPVRPDGYTGLDFFVSPANGPPLHRSVRLPRPKS